MFEPPETPIRLECMSDTGWGDGYVVGMSDAM